MNLVSVGVSVHSSTELSRSQTAIPKQVVDGVSEARLEGIRWDDGRVKASDWIRTRARIAKVERYRNMLAVLIIVLWYGVIC